MLGHGLKRALIVATAAIGILVAASAAVASPITVYSQPGKVYQNTANNPCIFYGPGTCPADPVGWPPPAGDTNQDPPMLTRDYAGADYAAFAAVAGTSFILGYDVNQTSNAEQLLGFSIYFNNALAYSFAGSLDLPDNNNGLGWADVILAAGCTGTVGAGTPPTCTGYAPFLVPAGTTSVKFTLDFTGNDGPDKVFLIPTGGPPPPVVPEPASLVLLGSGLVGVARMFRKRRA